MAPNGFFLSIIRGTILLPQGLTLALPRITHTGTLSKNGSLRNLGVKYFFLVYVPKDKLGVGIGHGVWNRQSKYRYDVRSYGAVQRRE
ncbi:hypothetical protein MFRU_004g02780 [Monilinia fructicola]|nr:hypothetical protein MFRU_004g02780 [Monilinia fructicola]